MAEPQQHTKAALTLEVDGGGVAFVTLDLPDAKHNILSRSVLEQLDGTLAEIEDGAREARIRAVVVRSGKAGSFIAGADVREIAAITDPAEGAAAAREGQRVLQRLADLRVPTVAAVNGVCLGGGTELILACDRRIAADADAVKIGLPEVRLGIIPGFGGTTRLPRLIGVREATAMIVTGGTVNARKAERLGLVDERVPAELLDRRAAELAAELAGGAAPAPRGPGLQRRLENSIAGRKLVLALARRQVLKETKGHYPAPLAALEAIDRTLGLSVEKALEVEARAIGRLITTDVSKNLIHVFFLMEGAKKAAPGAEPVPVERVGVLGAGTMGGGIAQLLAYNGLAVRLKDIDPDALALGLRHARGLFEKQVKRRRMTRLKADQAMERIAPTLEYDGFTGVDLVIEAVVERMDVKKKVLREVEAAVPARCVLTSNTSSLSVSEMQAAVERPERVAGMHFFNPVHRMPLVEVIRGRDSGDEAVATVFALSLRLGKTPILVEDGPGFLVNRLLSPYLNEAGWLLADGASIEDIDRALLDFGMPMGPLRLLDEVGLDVARHAAATMHEGFGERMRAAPPLTALERSDRLGKKNGRGFYAYEDGKATGPDAAVYADMAPAVPAERRTVPQQEIVDRTVLAMVNEAARVLRDGIVADAGTVDLGMITGTGFPPFRGGLLRWADRVGIGTVVQRLQELAQRHGDRFEPAPLLVEMAADGRGFYD